MSFVDALAIARTNDQGRQNAMLTQAAQYRMKMKELAAQAAQHAAALGFQMKQLDQQLADHALDRASREKLETMKAQTEQAHAEAQIAAQKALAQMHIDATAKEGQANRDNQLAMEQDRTKSSNLHTMVGAAGNFVSGLKNLGLELYKEAGRNDRADAGNQVKRDTASMRDVLARAKMDATQKYNDARLAIENGKLSETQKRTQLAALNQDFNQHMKLIDEGLKIDSSIMVNPEEQARLKAKLDFNPGLGPNAGFSNGAGGGAASPGAPSNGQPVAPSSTGPAPMSLTAPAPGAPSTPSAGSPVKSAAPLPQDAPASQLKSKMPDRSTKKGDNQVNQEYQDYMAKRQQIIDAAQAANAPKEQLQAALQELDNRVVAQKQAERGFTPVKSLDDTHFAVDGKMEPKSLMNLGTRMIRDMGDNLIVEPSTQLYDMFKLFGNRVTGRPEGEVYSDMAKNARAAIDEGQGSGYAPAVKQAAWQAAEIPVALAGGKIAGALANKLAPAAKWAGSKAVQLAEENAPTLAKLFKPAGEAAVQAAPAVGEATADSTGNWAGMVTPQAANPASTGQWAGMVTPQVEAAGADATRLGFKAPGAESIAAKMPGIVNGATNGLAAKVQDAARPVVPGINPAIGSSAEATVRYAGKTPGFDPYNLDKPTSPNFLKAFEGMMEGEPAVSSTATTKPPLSVPSAATTINSPVVPAAETQAEAGDSMWRAMQEAIRRKRLGLPPSPFKAGYDSDGNLVTNNPGDFE